MPRVNSYLSTHPFAAPFPLIPTDTQRYIQVQVQQDTPAYTIVTADGSVANSFNLMHYGRVVGMTEYFYPMGTIANVIDDLDVTNPAWSWSPNTRLYLNGMSISATPPSSGFSQRVAVARNANIIIMGLRVPMLL